MNIFKPLNLTLVAIAFIPLGLFSQQKPLVIPEFKQAAERTPQYPLKTQRMIYKDEDLAIARKNVEKYPKALEVKEIILNEAAYWIDWEDDDLDNLLATAQVPRAFDLNSRGCPEHGDEVFKKGGTYPWIIDSKHPFKVTCPVGNEVYPSNDYEKYYLSGFKDKKDWDTNYVDDGWGWTAPNGERYWFVAYANHWNWRRIENGILNLSRAYLLTKDKRYAHKAAVMLYKLAKIYPSMDYKDQSRYGLMSKTENRVYNGKVINYIWETGFIQNAAEAYDGIWETIDQDIELQKRYKKDGTAIRAFIEANLLEEAVDSYFQKKILGNYGMHQNALMYILLARQNMNTPKYINNLINEPGAGRDDAGLKYALYNMIFRDGLPLESPDYNSIWVNRIALLSDLFEKGGNNLFPNPRMKMLFDAPLKTVAAGRYTVDWGDSGSSLGRISGRDPDVYQIAYKFYNDPDYLTWLGGINRTGDQAFFNFASLFRNALPENEKVADGRAVVEQESRLFAGYGLGILNNKTDKTALAFTYGLHVSHFHWDFLNFELFANGQKMMPDLGYPDAMNAYVPEVYTWSSNTIAHNTVVVDGEKQNRNLHGVMHDFSEGEFARSMDVSSGAYSQTSQYRRNLIMVDVDDENSYVVDFFKVTGGKQHDYSLHGPPGTVLKTDGDWGNIQKGTLAGEDVEIGQIYDNATLGAKGYTGGYGGYRGSGFQHLFNVQKLKKGNGMLEYHHVSDNDARLRINLLQLDPQSVYIADAYDKPRAKNHVIKYLVSRRVAQGDEELKSTFVSVLEPYKKTPFILSSNLLTLIKGEGVAVEVNRDGFKDVVINDMQNSIKAVSQFKIETDANNAVVTFDSKGNPKRIFFSDGTYLNVGNRKFKSKGLKGEVVEVNVKENKLKIKLDKDSIFTPSTFNGKVAHFTNEYRTTVHPFLNVKKVGANLEFELKDDLLTGTVRLKDVKENLATTTNYLPFASLYSGSTILDKEYKPIGKLKKIEKGNLNMEKDVSMLMTAGDDVWISNLGVGDKIEVKATFSIILQ